MVGVENDGNAVDGSDGADVVGGSNGAGDGSLLLLSGVLHALAGEVGSATLAGLETVWTSIPSRALGFAGGAFYMMGAFASLAASRAATTVLERQSACFLQKDRPWLFGPKSGCIGLSAARNLEPAVRLSPQRGACVCSDAVWSCFFAVPHARGRRKVWEGRISHEPRAGDVAGGDGKLLLAGIGEELEHVVSCCPVNLPVSVGIGSGGFEP